MGMPITNSTMKILKFIHAHQNCTFSEIKAKFPDIDFMDLVCLALTDYLLCTRPGAIPTCFETGDFRVSDDDRFWATPNTTELIQRRRREWLQWVIPNVIAGVALILSIITLLLSQAPQVTEVRILP